MEVRRREVLGGEGRGGEWRGGEGRGGEWGGVEEKGGWVGGVRYNVMGCNGVIGFRVKGELCEWMEIRIGCQGICWCINTLGTLLVFGFWGFRGVGYV